MTDAQNVPPAVGDTDLPGARARVAALASAHASVASSDWTALPDLLDDVLDRG